MTDKKRIEPDGSIIAATSVGALPDVPHLPPLKQLLQPHSAIAHASTPLYNRDGDGDGRVVDSQSFGEYLFGSSYADPSLGGDAPRSNWSSYTHSRIYVRLFSRGLMGATLYTLANRWIPGQLRGYRPDVAFDRSKPLQYIARGFDIVYGKPIKAYVRTYYKMTGKSAEESIARAERATRFRTRRDFGHEGDPIMGRSLGAEIVGMTTDFAAGSIGDAWGRQIAGVFDPNIKNSWEDEQDGHVQWGKFAKAVGKSTWQIFSKNQGEDWVAALPYVYQMRFQRNVLGKMYRGFSLGSDHQLNGGSWRMDRNGNVVDTYAKAGALDLQLRFTGYNWYTLMYRDLYDNLSERIKHFRETGELSSPFTRTGQEGFLDNTAHLFRYVTKSAIKAGIYMTPAVPFFWASRTPQTKPHSYGIYVNKPEGKPHEYQFRPRPADPFGVGKQNAPGVFDRMLNPFGKACYKTSEAVNKAARSMGLASEAATQMGKIGSPTFVETWVNSSASYTPYMIAKAETALRWDRPKDAEGLNRMDRGIYRFIDGVARLNIGEVKGGLSDMREEIIRPTSNREINVKRSEQARRYAEETKEEETPDNSVTQVEDQERASPEQAIAGSWKAKQMRDQFMRSSNTPDGGATIH